MAWGERDSSKRWKERERERERERENACKCITYRKPLSL